MPDKPRIVIVDALRGWAILMMVAYHIIFDIDYFGIGSIDLHSLPLLLFQRATGSLFLLLAGVSIQLSERGNTEGYAHHLKRGLRLAGIAILITIATWIYPHEGFITFGIIHLIALSTIIAPFFLRFGKLNALFGACVVALGMLAAGMQSDSHQLFWLGLTYPGYTALDYYPLLPWFGVVLMGLCAGAVFFPHGEEARGSWIESRLAVLGRNSLLIYLVHQPLIVGIMIACKSIFG
ncbi:MAG: heparan-alpha-glucosaminide N-acetyltransferase [Candidatus Micrarchaeia archaeon]